MLGSCSCDLAATWQGRCGSALFQHSVEHSFRTTWHGKSFGKDHDRSRSRVHVDRAHARLADTQRLAIGLVIGRRTSPDGNTDAIASATSFTGSTRGFTRSESVGSLIVFESGYNGRSPLNSLHAEVAELADAHV